MKKLMYRQGLSARLVVAWVVIVGLLGAADQARAESTLVTASHSLATIPVLSANFSAPMMFSDGINGTTFFTVVGGPSQGTLAYRDVTNGIVNVAPGEPFCPSQYNWYYTSTNPLPGSDSFTWRCSDGPITSGLATVSIILATNSPPVALLAGTNSVPVNSSSIRYAFKSSEPDPYQVRMYRIVRLPTNGTLEGLTPAGDRVAIFVGEWESSSNYYYLAGATTGLDSFDWQCTDGIATSETRTVTLKTVANNAPYAGDSVYSAPTGSSRNFLSLENTLYMEAAFYIEHLSRDLGQPLSLQIIEAPTNGVLEYFNGTNYVVAVAGAWGAPNARWYYTPAGTSTAGDRFVWQASDGQAPSDPATMTITTYNYEPNGNDQSLRVVSPAGRTSVALLFGHYDETQPMTFLLTAAPAGGVVEYYDAALACYQSVPVGVPVATNTWYYTPTNGYLGADTIKWRVFDGVSTSATATVSILVVSNSVPVVRYMQVTCRPEDAWAGTADYTHADEGQRCTVSIVSNARHQMDRDSGYVIR